MDNDPRTLNSLPQPTRNRERLRVTNFRTLLRQFREDELYSFEYLTNSSDPLLKTRNQDKK